MLPGGGVDPIGITVIDHDVGHAGPLVIAQGFLPRLAAIGRLEEASISALPP